MALENGIQTDKILSSTSGNSLNPKKNIQITKRLYGLFMDSASPKELHTPPLLRNSNGKLLLLVETKGSEPEDIENRD